MIPTSAFASKIPWVVEFSRKRRVRIVVFGILFPVGVLLLLMSVILIVGYVSPSYAEEMYYWVQIVTGNWSSTGPYPRGSYFHAFWASLAILLNLGVIIAIIGIIKSLIQDREIIMKLANFLLVRDMAIQTRFLNSFPPEERGKMREVLRAAFRRGHDDTMQRGLAAVFSDPERAERMREIIPNAEVGPYT